MFIVLGINHTTAALEVREKVAFSPDTVTEALASAMSLPEVNAVAILSTCNRTEIYAEVERSVNPLFHWIAQWHQVEAASLDSSCYLYEGEAAARHLMKVASGLDSLVLGEPQILGQIKSSYAVAQQAKSLSAAMNRTFQLTFAVAKQVRSETAIGRNPVSVAYAAVSLARQIFTTLENKTALLIGAGETITLVARHLREQGLQNMIIANRTLERAQQLADEFGAKAILLAEIPEYLHLADVVVSSTASQLPLLGKGAVEAALKQRRHRIMFMVDLAVPRDIESQVSELEDVFLYTVDDLSTVVAENQRSREIAAEEALNIIDQGVKSWRNAQRSQEGIELVKQYRQQAYSIRNAEVEKALAQLQRGVDPHDVLSRLATDLTNKLIHVPTTKLSEMSVSENLQLMQWSSALLGLESIEAVDGKKSDPS